MGFSEKINVIFDADTKGFSSSLKGLRSDVANADGAMGKLKAGAGGLGDVLKQNAGAAALAAGAALVTFGVKAVNAFQDTALAAGKFSDATGIAVEDASRWIEVAGDIGIEAGAVQGAFRKMNKSIADGKSSWTEYGVEIVKTKDGLVDSNATFILAATTIGAIEDPTKRAKAAQEVFGKSYGEVAELMEMSATDLSIALAGVSDAKVIDEKELAKAREFRATMDKVGDVVQDVQLAVGELIVENAGLIDSFADQVAVVAEYSEQIGIASRALLAMASPIQGVREVMGLASDEISFTGSTLEELQAWLEKNGASAEVTAQAIAKWNDAQADAASETKLLAGEVDAATESLTDMERAVKSLNDELSDDESWINLQDKLSQYRADMHDASLSNNEKRLSIINTKQALLEYLGALEGVPEDKQTDILALIDQGRLDEAEQALQYLSRQRVVAINPQTGGQAPNVSTGVNGRRAEGGPVSAGGTYLVGEKGPELLQMGGGGGNVVPNRALGGDTYVFNQIGMTTDQLVRLVEQAKRKHGRSFLS